MNYDLSTLSTLYKHSPLDAQKELEANLLQHGYNRSITEAADAYDKALAGGNVLALPKGTALFLNTLTSVTAWFDKLVKSQLKGSPKTNFYKLLLAPYTSIYLEDQSKVKKNKYYISKYENPIELLPYFLTRELTRLMVEETRTAVEFSRRVVNSFTMSYNHFDEATPEELAAMLQLTRTYMSDASNKLFTEYTDNHGVHFTLNTQFSKLHVTKRELLDSVPNDKSPYKPMLCPPVNHENLLSTEGGYITLQSPLLKNSVFDIIRQIPFHNNEWLRSINRLQQTKWSINTSFYYWLKECSYEGISKYFNTNAHDLQVSNTKKVKRVKRRIKRKSTFITKVRVASKRTLDIKYKTKCERVIANIMDEIELHELTILELKSVVSQSRGWEDTIADAEFFSNFDYFYHPLFADNRGRLYTYNTSISFQGNSLAKSLVCTHHRERMTEEAVEGVFELLGGMFTGYSKKVKEIRIQLVNRILPELWKVVEKEDYSILDEIDEDELLCALVLIYELYQHFHNSSYKTGVLAYIDSTSSAIQIQAVTQKCIKAATLTNLVPVEGDDLPDAYQSVASSCESMVQEIVDMSKEELYASMCAYFIEHAPEKLAYAGINLG